MRIEYDHKEITIRKILMGRDIDEKNRGVSKDDLMISILISLSYQSDCPPPE